MRKRLHETAYAFDDISEKITDIKIVLKLYEERLRESAEEPRTQSILRGQLRLLDLIEKECDDFAERLDQLTIDYLHGRISTDTSGIYANSLKE